MSEGRPALRALASRLGILDGYRGVDGHDRETSDSTREAIVTAMGHVAHDEAAAARALEALDEDARARIVEPVLVWREWAEGSPELCVNARAIGDARDYHVEIRLEDGRKETSAGHLPDAGPDGVVVLPLPLRPPHGHHDVHLHLDGASGARRAVQRLVMTPRTVVQPEELLGEGHAFGLSTNLYSVRAQGDWGRGGLRELGRLGRLAGELGAAFVGINPLHAVANRGLDFSPYGPVSRLYRNALYLDPEAVPELAQSPAARALLGDPRLRARRAALEASSQIDHEAILDLMLPVLRELHATFTQVASPARMNAYAVYKDDEGEPLHLFATWEALAAYLAESGRIARAASTDWRRWPRALRDHRSTMVEAFRLGHRHEIDFRCWLQFELDRQLSEAADGARRAGCALGVYQDLALGSSSASADTWMSPELYASGVNVGAPPDAYAPEGQDWGLPPVDPHRLRDDGYRPWSRLLRAAFAHNGALRIDHAMGLVRLFWIPEGRPGSEGAYVSYPASDLLGVLALESRRQGAVVVAEDLGTLPPELPGLLADWGLMRSAVLHFEHSGERFRPPSEYPARALASAGTHDLAPLAGHFEGVDLGLRRRCGASESVDDALRERAAARRELVAALRAEGLLSHDAEPDDAALRDAVHAFISRTPSALVAVSLDDLVGEREPVNLPGVPLDLHRSWSRRMSRPLEELAGSAELRSALEPLRDRARHPARTDDGDAT